MNTLTSLKIVPTAASNFCSGFLSLSLVNCSRKHSWPAFGTIVKITGDFRNNFLWLQVAIGELERASWIGLLEISQFVSEVIEAIRNFILDFLRKKTTNRLIKTISAHTKYTVVICRTFRKHFISLHISLIERKKKIAEFSWALVCCWIQICRTCWWRRTRSKWEKNTHTVIISVILWDSLFTNFSICPSYKLSIIVAAFNSIIN